MRALRMHISKQVPGIQSACIIEASKFGSSRTVHSFVGYLSKLGTRKELETKLRLNVGRMEHSMAAQVIVGGGGGGGGMRLSIFRSKASLFQLRLSPSPMALSLATSPHSLRGSGRRTFIVDRQHFVSRSQATSLLCMVIPKEGSQELKQQQELSTIAADSPSFQTQASAVVEHVVFFKMKDDPKTEELFEELRALKSLDVVSELNASKVRQILGANYTHALHSRHPNRAALDAYARHPSHLAVVKKLFPFIEDRLAVDWESVPKGLPIKGGHGAARIALIKLTEYLTEEESSQVFGFLNSLKDRLPIIRQISTGPNFSPARAKGFNLGFLAMFENVEELQRLDRESELRGELRESGVAPFLESTVIVDLVSNYG